MGTFVSKGICYFKHGLWVGLCLLVFIGCEKKSEKSKKANGSSELAAVQQEDFTSMLSELGLGEAEFEAIGTGEVLTLSTLMKSSARNVLSFGEGNIGGISALLEGKSDPSVEVDPAHARSLLETVRDFMNRPIPCRVRGNFEIFGRDTSNAGVDRVSEEYGVRLDRCVMTPSLVAHGEFKIFFDIQFNEDASINSYAITVKTDRAVVVVKHEFDGPEGELEDKLYGVSYFQEFLHTNIEGGFTTTNHVSARGPFETEETVCDSTITTTGGTSIDDPVKEDWSVTCSGNGHDVAESGVNEQPEAVTLEWNDDGTSKVITDKIYDEQSYLLKLPEGIDHEAIVVVDQLENPLTSPRILWNLAPLHETAKRSCFSGTEFDGSTLQARCLTGALDRDRTYVLKVVNLAFSSIPSSVSYRLSILPLEEESDDIQGIPLTRNLLSSTLALPLTLVEGESYRGAMDHLDYNSSLGEYSKVYKVTPSFTGTYYMYLFGSDSEDSPRVSIQDTDDSPVPCHEVSDRDNTCAVELSAGKEYRVKLAAEVQQWLDVTLYPFEIADEDSEGEEKLERTRSNRLNRPLTVAELGFQITGMSLSSDGTTGNVSVSLVHLGDPRTYSFHVGSDPAVLSSPRIQGLAPRVIVPAAPSMNSVKATLSGVALDQELYIGLAITNEAGELKEVLRPRKLYIPSELKAYYPLKSDVSKLQPNGTFEQGTKSANHRFDFSLGLTVNTQRRWEKSYIPSDILDDLESFTVMFDTEIQSGNKRRIMYLRWQNGFKVYSYGRKIYLRVGSWYFSQQFKTGTHSVTITRDSENKSIKMYRNELQLMERHGIKNNANRPITGNLSRETQLLYSFSAKICRWSFCPVYNDDIHMKNLWVLGKSVGPDEFQKIRHNGRTATIAPLSVIDNSLNFSKNNVSETRIALTLNWTKAIAQDPEALSYCVHYSDGTTALTDLDAIKASPQVGCGLDIESYDVSNAIPFTIADTPRHFYVVVSDPVMLMEAFYSGFHTGSRSDTELSLDLDTKTLSWGSILPSQGGSANYSVYIGSSSQDSESIYGNINTIRNNLSPVQTGSATTYSGPDLDAILNDGITDTSYQIYVVSEDILARATTLESLTTLSVSDASVRWKKLSPNSHELSWTGSIYPNTGENRDLCIYEANQIYTTAADVRTAAAMNYPDTDVRHAAILNDLDGDGHCGLEATNYSIRGSVDYRSATYFHVVLKDLLTGEEFLYDVKQTPYLSEPSLEVSGNKLSWTALSSGGETVTYCVYRERQPNLSSYQLGDPSICTEETEYTLSELVNSSFPTQPRYLYVKASTPVSESNIHVMYDFFQMPSLSDKGVRYNSNSEILSWTAARTASGGSLSYTLYYGEGSTLMNLSQIKDLPDFVNGPSQPDDYDSSSVIGYDISSIIGAEIKRDPVNVYVVVEDAERNIEGLYNPFWTASIPDSATSYDASTQTLSWKAASASLLQYSLTYCVYRSSSSYSTVSALQSAVTGDCAVAVSGFDMSYTLSSALSEDSTEYLYVVATDATMGLSGMYDVYANTTLPNPNLSFSSGVLSWDAASALDGANLSYCVYSTSGTPYTRSPEDLRAYAAEEACDLTALNYDLSADNRFNTLDDRRFTLSVVAKNEDTGDEVMYEPYTRPYISGKNIYVEDNRLFWTATVGTNLDLEYCLYSSDSLYTSRADLMSGGKEDFSCEDAIDGEMPSREVTNVIDDEIGSSPSYLYIVAHDRNSGLHSLYAYINTYLPTDQSDLSVVEVNESTQLQWTLASPVNNEADSLNSSVYRGMEHFIYAASDLYNTYAELEADVDSNDSTELVEHQQVLNRFSHATSNMSYTMGDDLLARHLEEDLYLYVVAVDHETGAKGMYHPFFWDQPFVVLDKTLTVTDTTLTWKAATRSDTSYCVYYSGGIGYNGVNGIRNNAVIDNISCDAQNIVVSGSDVSYTLSQDLQNEMIGDSHFLYVIASYGGTSIVYNTGRPAFDATLTYIEPVLRFQKVPQEHVEYCVYWRYSYEDWVSDNVGCSQENIQIDDATGEVTYTLTRNPDVRDSSWGWAQSVRVWAEHTNGPQHVRYREVFFGHSKPSDPIEFLDSPDMKITLPAVSYDREQSYCVYSSSTLYQTAYDLLNGGSTELICSDDNSGELTVSSIENGRAQVTYSMSSEQWSLLHDTPLYVYVTVFEVSEFLNYTVLLEPYLNVTLPDDKGITLTQDSMTWNLPNVSNMETCVYSSSVGNRTIDDIDSSDKQGCTTDEGSTRFSTDTVNGTMTYTFTDSLKSRFGEGALYLYVKVQDKLYDVAALPYLPDDQLKFSEDNSSFSWRLLSTSADYCLYIHDAELNSVEQIEAGATRLNGTDCSGVSTSGDFGEYAITPEIRTRIDNGDNFYLIATDQVLGLKLSYNSLKPAPSTGLVLRYNEGNRRISFDHPRDGGFTYRLFESIGTHYTEISDILEDASAGGLIKEVGNGWCPSITREQQNSCDKVLNRAFDVQYLYLLATHSVTKQRILYTPFEEPSRLVAKYSFDGDGGLDLSSHFGDLNGVADSDSDGASTQVESIRFYPDPDDGHVSSARTYGYYTPPSPTSGFSVSASQSDLNIFGNNPGSFTITMWVNNPDPDVVVRNLFNLEVDGDEVLKIHQESAGMVCMYKHVGNGHPQSFERYDGASGPSPENCNGEDGDYRFQMRPDTTPVGKIVFNRGDSEEVLTTTPLQVDGATRDRIGQSFDLSDTFRFIAVVVSANIIQVHQYEPSPDFDAGDASFSYEVSLFSPPGFRTRIYESANGVDPSSDENYTFRFSGMNIADLRIFGEKLEPWDLATVMQHFVFRRSGN